MGEVTLSGLSNPIEIWPALASLVEGASGSRHVKLTREQERLVNEDRARVAAWEADFHEPVDIFALPSVSDPARMIRLMPQSVIVDHVHTWRFYGDAQRAADVFGEAARKIRTWDYSRCAAPFFVVCSDEGCDAGLVVACNATNAEVCEPCELRYRKQVRTVVREPMFMARKDSLLLLTLTAPGDGRRHCLAHTYPKKNPKTGQVDYLPSYRCFQTHAGEEHRVCPCGEEGHALPDWEAMGVWNLSAVARWNDFATDLRRGVPGFDDFEYFRAVEAQARGAIHFHVVIRLTGPHRLFTTEHLDKIRTYALRHGFGHQVDVQKIGDGKEDQVKAARYVAKYVSKAKGEDRKLIALPSAPAPVVPDMSSVVSVDIFTGEVFEADHDEAAPLAQPYGRMWDINTDRRKQVQYRRGQYVYRTWFASRNWGLSMTGVRAIQKVWGVDGAEAAQDLQTRLFILAGLIESWPGSPPT